MDNLNYQVLGMHFIWWFLWIFILIWIFATPYEIPGQRSKKGSPLDILKKRYAAGQITKDEYLKSKKNLEIC
jgi:putative membrane protein